MCFFYGINKNKKAIESQMNLKFDQAGFEVVNEVNGFSHPFMPIILDKSPEIITGGNWGLLPTWAKNTSFQNSTLNALIETIGKNLSFKNHVNERCLIIATHFYEWQWLDPKRKEKQKYSIGINDGEIFCFAGLYSMWKDPETGYDKLTFTILTTEANELMVKINNGKKKMPVVLNHNHHQLWLQGEDYSNFANPYEVHLVATPV
ncbi:SOS response-associated peptidase family protein [Flavobacterium dauae]|uniref:SOS response-associated peptidase n=1 Tax=Flavobacterium dauae TaxID=1563479 RepID=UPI00101B3A77|nr:SOS response-associated peptidase family protein [Flavobacterium dauae]WLD24720.1 SOS response-associated peptidase family protein [Flavobacterium dauae]